MASLLDARRGTPLSYTPMEDRRPVLAIDPNQTDMQNTIDSAGESGAFGQGVARGARGIKSGIRNAVGTAAEVTGANQFAQDQYNAAQRENELSAAGSPDVPELNQVHDLASGARFVAGNTGAALPYLAPTLAGTAGLRAAQMSLPRTAAIMTGVNAVPMIGNEQERLRADPVTAQLPASERAAISVGKGVADAAIYHAVPAAITERAISAAPALSKNVLTNTARDAALSGVGQGAAAAASEVGANEIQNTLNPDRDTSHDADNVIAAGVGNAAAMAPLAVPHAALANTVGAGVKAVRNSNVVPGGRDWLATRLERRNDPDMNTLNTTQRVPAGLDPDTADQWMQGDDAARNAAATKVAQQYVNDPSAPENLKQAGEDFLNGPKTDDAWKTISDAGPYQQHIDTVKAGLINLADRVKNGVQGAKDAVTERNARENAQTPLVDNSFDSLLADKLLEHTGLRSSDEIINELPGAVQGMKSWVKAAVDGNGTSDLKAPKGLFHAFQDPAQATQDTYDLMRKQGLVSDRPDRVEKLVKALGAHGNERKAVGSIVEDNLLPTAQNDHQFSGAEHVKLGEHIMQWIQHGGKRDDKRDDKLEATLDELFGHNKEKVLQALDEKVPKYKGQNQLDEKAPLDDNSDDAEAAGSHEELAGITDPLNPNEAKAETKYEGLYDTHNEGSARGLQDKLNELNTTGRDAEAIGVVDHLREIHHNDPEGFVRAMVDLVTKHGDKLSENERSRPEVHLNNRLKTIKSIDGTSKREGTEVKGEEFNNVTNPKSSKWALSPGKNGEYAGPEHGRLWFERVNPHGVIDKATGEVKADLFNTSASRIITRMRQGMKDIGGNRRDGLLDQHDMLMHGISSLLNAKREDGSLALSGRVGIKENGQIRWLSGKDALPNNFKLPTGTFGEYKAEARSAHTESVKNAMKDWLSQNPDHAGAESVSEALKDNNVDKLAALRDKYVRDSYGNDEPKPIATERETKITGKSVDPETEIQSHITSTETKALSEGEEMSAAAVKREANTPRTHDETTSEELHPKFRTEEPSLEQLQAREEQNKQVDYLMRTLREKGIPAFNRLAEKLTPEQNAAMRETLGKMLEAKTPDNPIWNGNPPKDFTSFGNRARAAVARLEGFKEPVRANEQSNFDGKELSAEDQARIRADVQRRLGDNVAVEFSKKLFSSGDSAREISGEWRDHLMKISMQAHSPDQVAAHESYHEFFNRLSTSGIKGAEKVIKILNNAANSVAVERQLSRLLDAHPEALKQIDKASPNYAEERQAYMFQFWQAGLLKIGPETTSVFKKISDFFRKVSGLLSDDQKAERLLQAFESGEARTADAAAKVLAENLEYRGKQIQAMRETFDPVIEKLSRFFLSNEAILMHSDNPHFQSILRDMKNPTGESVQQSMVEAKGQQMSIHMNAFEGLTRGAEKGDLELASKYLHIGTGERPRDPVARKIFDGTRAILDKLDNYLREAGVKKLETTELDGKPVSQWTDFGHRENYYPQAYNMEKVVKDAEGFKKALYDNHSAIIDNIVETANKELKSGDELTDSYASAIAKSKGLTEVTRDDVLSAITDRIINAYGHIDLDESTSDLGFSPGMRALNQRSLDWLDKRAMGDWMNNDMVNVMTSYIAQAVKRAEYVRRFENGGEGLKNRVDQAYQYEQAKLIAEQTGADVEAVAANLKQAKKELSDDVGKLEADALAKMQGPVKNIMAMEGTLGYDIDPTMRRLQGTLMAYENLRTMGTSLFSTLIDPLGVLVRGGEMKDVWDGYVRGLREIKSSWTGKRIEDNQAAVAEMIGTVDSGGFLANFGQAYSSLYLNKHVRHWNEGLFKWNGMEGMNRGMRIAATQAAISFMKRQVTNPDEHSARYLDELLLKPEDVVIDGNGDLNYNDPKIQAAARRWVDGAILRPNAAHRTAWMSDPHFAVFGHMKQFAYTFHDTIMKRAWQEAKLHDNFGPMGILAATFTPMMIAADVAKSLLLTGEAPAFIHEGLGATIDHGVRRAGLMGFATPYIDPIVTGHPASMFGPTVEQGVSAFTQPFEKTAWDALPGESIINTVRGQPEMNLMTDD